MWQIPPVKLRSQSWSPERVPTGLTGWAVVVTARHLEHPQIHQTPQPSVCLTRRAAQPQRQIPHRHRPTHQPAPVQVPVRDHRHYSRSRIVIRPGNRQLQPRITARSVVGTHRPPIRRPQLGLPRPVRPTPVCSGRVLPEHRPRGVVLSSLIPGPHPVAPQRPRRPTREHRPIRTRTRHQLQRRQLLGREPIPPPPCPNSRAGRHRDRGRTRAVRHAHRSVISR